jgi:hypothetical protein
LKVDFVSGMPHPIFRRQFRRLESGESKMVVDLLDQQTVLRLVLIGILCVMFSAVGYARGHKDGSREGFTRGRAVSRHASREVK